MKTQDKVTFDNVALALTAIPREIEIERTIRSIRFGGFADTLHIFAEPGFDPELDIPDVVWHHAPEQLGAMWNWKRAHQELSSYEYVMAFQDDVLLSAHAARALKRLLSSNAPVAMASLYVQRQRGSRYLRRQPPGWVQRPRTINTGLVAALHRSDLLARYFESEEHRELMAAWVGQLRGPNFDYNSSTWLNTQPEGEYIYWHNPSLATIGSMESTIGHRMGGQHRGWRFTYD